MYLEPEPTPRGLAAVADADAVVACRRFLPPLALAPPLPISSANASLLPPPLRFFLDELLIPSYENSKQDAAAKSSWPGAYTPTRLVLPVVHTYDAPAYKNEAGCDGNFDATEINDKKDPKRTHKNIARTAKLRTGSSRKILIVLHHEIRSARNLAYAFLVPSHAC